MKNLFKAENLNTVEFDQDNNRYYLEFHADGEKASIYVDADNYPEAATDEFYFAEDENIERAIQEAKEDGQF